MSAGQPPAAAGPMPAGRVEEVADGVFAYVQPDGTWWINNAGFLIGTRGVVAVDTCATEARTRGLRDAIRGVSDRPVRTLVNTHHHGDHTFGNGAFPEATIVGHELTRTEVLAAGGPPPEGVWEHVEWGRVQIEAPFLTFSDAVTLWVDDVRVEVRHTGTAAHTTNDSYLWLPDRGVLYTGDLVFNGGTPFVLMGSVTGAIEAVGALRELGAATVVPGHGPVCGPEVFDTVLGYLHFVLDAAGEARRSGTTPLDAARQLDLGPWAELTDRERIVGNLHRAMLDLDGAAPGAPIDLLAAIGDMLTYNGGRPLSCHA